MIIAGDTSPEADEAERVAKRVEATKKRIGRGTASGLEVKLVDTQLSGPALVNDVAGVIPAITSFVTSEVVISDDENPWIERE